MIRVAHVDDNPDLRDLVRLILERECEVSEYADGASALARLPDAVPEVVLLDTRLPDFDGVTMLRRLRQDRRLRGVPIVALTSCSTPGDRAYFLANGFDEYVAKPILDIPGFIALVRRLSKRDPAELISPTALGSEDGAVPHPWARSALGLIEAIRGTVVRDGLAVRPQRDALAIDRFLDALERLVPDSPELHDQIYAVRCWVRVMYGAREYERFGGREPVRQHVVGILTRARSSVASYFGDAKRLP